jgi:hypothetical protein
VDWRLLKRSRYTVAALKASHDIYYYSMMSIEQTAHIWQVHGRRTPTDPLWLDRSAFAAYRRAQQLIRTPTIAIVLGLSARIRTHK